MLAFIYVPDENINMILNGVPYSISVEHLNFYKIVDELHGNQDENKLLGLLDLPKSVSHYTDGQVSVLDDKVLLNGKEIHGHLIDRILDLHKAGYNKKYLLNFLQNLQLNPSYHSIQSLFDFLSHQGLPITEDGCFLGYKSVLPSFKDVYTNTIDNSIGQIVSMPRNEVNDDNSSACKSGLHVGTLEYATNYNKGENIIIVKVNPADVVTVPTYDTNKLRVCRYEVIAQHKDNKHLSEGIYNVSGKNYISPNSYTIKDLAVGDRFKFADLDGEESLSTYRVEYIGNDTDVIVRIIAGATSRFLNKTIAFPIDMTHKLIKIDE